jgi:hypothetical protein
MFISSQHLAGVLHGFIFTALLCLTGLFALGAVFSSYQFELMGYTALLGEVGQSQPLEALDLTVPLCQRSCPPLCFSSISQVGRIG